MANRRQFLKDAATAAGVVFTGCCLAAGKLGAQPANPPKHREVMVGGRRIRTIDIHAHVVVPEATALLGRKTNTDDAGIMDGAMATERFARMDEWGTDMQALSINPTWYSAERDVVTQGIKLQNEKLADLCAKYPDRFVAFRSE